MNMWRVYYDDGTTCDITQKLPSNFGVLCILQYGNFHGNKSQYYITHGGKYYIFHEGEWLIAHESDLVDFLIRKKTIDHLLVGGLTTKSNFEKVFEVAKHDKDKEIFGMDLDPRRI